MATTVHIPAPLLKQVDRRAKALRVSRNRLIVRALEREVHASSNWSPEFLDWLKTGPSSEADVDDMLAAITRARRSKRTVDL